MQDEELLVLTSGPYRLAVAPGSVKQLTRALPGTSIPSLASLFNRESVEEQEYALTVCGAGTELQVRVSRADLQRRLPRYPLPQLLAKTTHTAVTGLVLDGTDMIPIVDLTQLIYQTGHNLT
jgi:hypothetical protein